MSESEDSVVFSLRLSGKELEKWKNYCKTHLANASPPSAEKTLILQLMDPGVSTDYLKSSLMLVKKGRTGSINKTVKVTLSESEFEAIKSAAEASDISSAAYIASCARAGLRLEGEPMPREFSELIRSNRVISELGGNINQIARQLNKKSKQFEPQAVKMNDLAEAISNHKTVVNKFIQSCASRWDFQNFPAKRE